jgi:hypothetical protein
MFFALVAQLAEHHHGKVGVIGSNPIEGFFLFFLGKSGTGESRQGVIQWQAVRKRGRLKR